MIVSTQIGGACANIVWTPLRIYWAVLCKYCRAGYILWSLRSQGRQHFQIWRHFWRTRGSQPPTPKWRTAQIHLHVAISQKYICWNLHCCESSSYQIRKTCVELTRTSVDIGTLRQKIIFAWVTWAAFNYIVMLLTITTKIHPICETQEPRQKRSISFNPVYVGEGFFFGYVSAGMISGCATSEISQQP